MFAPFQNLPYEIQLEIFQLAADTERTPRVIEVYYKKGQLYSQQRPPALLQVCKLSRYVVQKIYKPWLPQFVGTLAHQPWETIVKKKGIERWSKLQNVYIDMELDTLLISSRICRAGVFGEIERQILRNMAVVMDGYITFMDIAKCARQCGGLRNLDLFEGETGKGHTSFKAGRIHLGIERLAKKKLRKKELPYQVPRITTEHIESPKPSSRNIESWYRYKYPDGCFASQHFSYTVDRFCLSKQGELELELEELKGASADLDGLGGCPRASTSTSGKTTTKRKRYRLDAPQISDTISRKSAKASHSSRPKRHESNSAPNPIATSGRRVNRPITPPASSPIRAEHIPRQGTSQSVWVRPPKDFNYSYFEDGALSPTPSPEPEQSPESIDLPAHPRATPQTPVPPQHDPFHEWTELDWESLLEPSSPPDQFTTPHIEQFIDIPPSSEQPVYIDPRNIWGDLENERKSLTLKDTEPADMARSKRAIIKPKVTEEIDEAEEERLLQLQLQAELENEDEAETSNTKVQGPMTPESEEPESSGVPARIRAERHAENEVQLLVQWKNYPDEKDWTWEVESELKQSVPKMMQAWRARKSREMDEAEAVLEDEVEKILGKRKWKGEPHYLVKWKGYEDIESRTWQPCDRLKVDVPEIVEEYESKSKKKGKARK